MNEVSGTVVDLRGAGAYARADALSSAVPIRSVDPARPRFAVVDGGNAAKAQGRPQATGLPTDSASDAQQAPAPAERGPGLLGALTGFLVRAFSPASEVEASQASSLLNGLRAYARAALGQGGSQQAGVEVISPSLPRLSSGRSLDLSV